MKLIFNLLLYSFILFFSVQLISQEKPTAVKNKDSGVMGSFTYMNGIGDSGYYSEVGVTPLGTIYAVERANVIQKPFAGITVYACNVKWLKDYITKTVCGSEKTAFLIGGTFGINQASDNKSISYLYGITFGYLFNNDLLVGLTYGGFNDSVKTLPYPYRESFLHPLIQPGSTPDASYALYDVPLETRQGFYKGFGFTISKKIEFQGDEEKETGPPLTTQNNK